MGGLIAGSKNSGVFAAYLGKNVQKIFLEYKFKEIILRAMEKDEFGNHLPIENGSTSIREFAPVQRTEFSSYEDNPNPRKIAANSTKTNNDDPTASSGSRGSRKTWTGSNITKITHSAASGASVGHAVAVAATTVSVVAVSTLVGIKTVTDSHASVLFRRFSMVENQLCYVLSLRDFQDDEDPFSIKVENKSYSSSRELVAGDNEGVFEGLEPSQVYTVTVSQQRLGGKTIYNESFTFEDNYVEPPVEPQFFGMDFDESADFEHHTFVVTLRYEDPENALHDFSLHLKPVEGTAASFQLDKTLEAQTVSFEEGQLQPHMTYTYEIHYFDGDHEVTFVGKEFVLQGESVPQAQFFGMDFDHTADFKNNTFVVTLRYEDPEDTLHDFSLTLTPSVGDAVTFSLEKTLSAQTVSFQEGALLPDTNYDYEIRYFDGDSELAFTGEPFVLEGEMPVEPQFLGMEFDHTADFTNRAFALALLYDDPEDVLHDFSLTLKPVEGTEATFSLEKTTDVQTVHFQEGQLTPMMTYDYEIHYYNEEREVTFAGEEFVLQGELPVTASIRDVTWNWEADYLTGEASIVIDYEDPNNELTDFALLIKEDGKADTTISLAKTTDAQTIDLSSLSLSDPSRTFTFSLTYLRSGASESYEIGTGTIADTATPYASVEIATTFDLRARTFVATLDYHDTNGLFRDFVISMTPVTGGSFDIDLEKTKEPQTLSFPEDVALSADGVTFQYALSYYDETIKDRTSTPGEIWMNDPDYEPIEGMLNGIDFQQKINFRTGVFSLALDYEDPDNRITDLSLVLEGEDFPGPFVFPLEKTTTSQSCTFHDFVAKNMSYDSFHYTLKYLYDGVEKTFAGPSDGFTFTNNAESSFTGVTSPFYITSSNSFYLKLNCYDGAGIYSSPQIVITDQDGGTILEQYLGQSGETVEEWNYVYAGDAAIEFGKTYYLTVKMDVDDGTGVTGPTTQTMVDRQPITFADGSSNPSISGLRVSSFETNTENPSFFFTPIYSALDGLSNFKILIRFGEGDVYEFPIDLEDFPSHGNGLNVDFRELLADEDEADFIQKLSTLPVDVGFSYLDSTAKETILYDYVGAIFAVS